MSHADDRPGDDRSTGDTDPGRGGSTPDGPPEAGQAVPGQVMRPVWRRPATPGTLAHRPAITAHPARWHPGLLQPKARTEQVVVTRRGTFGPRDPGAPGRWALFFGSSTTYEVDLGLHHTDFPLALPSAGNTFDFRCEVFVAWRVRCAVRVVRDGLDDIREALRPVVLQKLGDVTRCFDVGDVSAAEQAVARRIEGLDLGEPYGLRVDLTLRLSADEDATEHAASRRKVEFQGVLDSLEHDCERRRVAYEREVIEARMELYRGIIDSGDVEHLALQLAQNPAGVEAIIRLVREDRQHDRRQITDFVTHMVETGAIDRWDVNDHVKAALTWLGKATDRTVLTGDAHIPRERRPSHPGMNGHAAEPVGATNGAGPPGDGDVS